MNIQIDDGVPVGEAPRRGPRKDERLAAIDAKVFIELNAGAYKSLWAAAKAYVDCYYPDCNEDRRKARIDRITNRLKAYPVK